MDAVKCIIKVDQQSRHLLALMNFEEIPKEANYIAFYEDGLAQFIEEVEFQTVAIPTLTFIQYYEKGLVELTD